MKINLVLLGERKVIECIRWHMFLNERKKLQMNCSIVFIISSDKDCLVVQASGRLTVW